MGPSKGLIDRRAREVEDILRSASNLRGLIGPRADSGLWVEDETRGTGDHVAHTLDAIEELVTDAFHGVRKVAVLPGAVRCGIGLL